jgi:ribulose-5-phosphate 4-epimerase/fuculose-1-phosphate aldolase
VDYAMPSTPELAHLVAERSLEADVLVLANHGIVVCSDSLETCFQKLEVAEETARIQYLLLGSGPCKRLSERDKLQIEQKFHCKKTI